MIGLPVIAGVAIYAHYATLGCGPLSSGEIENANQVHNTQLIWPVNSRSPYCNALPSLLAARAALRDGSAQLSRRSWSLRGEHRSRRSQVSLPLLYTFKSLVHYLAILILQLGVVCSQRGCVDDVRRHRATHVPPHAAG